MRRAGSLEEDRTFDLYAQQRVLFEAVLLPEQSSSHQLLADALNLGLAGRERRASRVHRVAPERVVRQPT